MDACTRRVVPKRQIIHSMLCPCVHFTVPISTSMHTTIMINISYFTSNSPGFTFCLLFVASKMALVMASSAAKFDDDAADAGHTAAILKKPLPNYIFIQCTLYSDNE